jgi:translation initiation factor 1
VSGESRLVYSTHGGRVHPPGDRPRTPSAPRDGVVRIRRERGGRGGKVVTLIYGLPTGPSLASLAVELKRWCGAGGTVKDGVVEIQGDHRDRVAARLRELGHTVKLAGG